MSRPRRSQPKSSVRPVDVLAQFNQNAAGLAIGATEIYAAVPADRAEPCVRVFPTFTVDLQALVDWLSTCGVTTVAMESTGIYWLPLYELLEARGLQVFLVNPKHLKNVSGRKTDVLDCQWLQQLHSYGLLCSSFRPPAEICTLRAFVRQREMLIRHRASPILQMQKALHLMNLQLDNVLSDITGQTGMCIIRAILAGERDPQRLAAYRNGRCQRSSAEIAKALQGTYKAEHLFALQQAVEAYDFYTQQIQVCNATIEQHYAALELATPDLPPLLPSTKAAQRQRDIDPDFALRTQLYQLAGVDLTQIAGIGVNLAQTILAEVGVDMTRWPTSKHFAAWLGLAPNNRISGGKVLTRATNHVLSPANLAFRQAAQAVAKTPSALGAFYRRLRAKYGPAHANVATAHKLARIVYAMLTTHQPYHDLGAQAYDAQTRQRLVHKLKRKAQELGFTLSPFDAQQGVSVS